MLYLTLLPLILVSVVFSQNNNINFNVQQNEKQHHTTDYKTRNQIPPDDPARMIIRRGQPFTIDISSKITYSFVLIPFEPISKTKDTSNVITIPLVQQHSSDVWEAVAAPISNGYRYTIYSPADSKTGIFFWQLVDSSGSKSLLTNQLVVLFNPWNVNDQVYYPSQTELSEYLLNSQTLLWVGSSSQSSNFGWIYDQFHYAVLEVTLYFLYQLPFEQRGDVGLVSRHLSAWINVNDEGGLIWGRWQDPYTGGKNPTYWTGSLEIFQQYRTTLQSVKYGQCWVFGACLTSAGRSLGIPSRTITNFDSAHESQGDPVKYRMQLDVFYDKNGQYLGMDGGSIWNFHVWCEFYFSRSDISNANGWQAVDGTPQELSDGLFQMGPAALVSVKSLDTKSPYDVDFVASEVGASIYQWAQYDTGKEKNPDRPGFWLLDIEKDGTGHMISTKAVGQMARQDITSLYKNTFGNVLSKGFGKQQHIDENITFAIVAPTEVDLGDNVTITIYATCETCTVDGSYLQFAVDIRMISYIGNVIGEIEKGLIIIPLDGAITVHEFVVPREDYQTLLGMNRLIEYNTFVQYYENYTFTGLYVSWQGRIQLLPPPLILTPLTPLNSTILHFTASWENPLTIPLHNVILRIAGAYVAEEDIWVGLVEGRGKVLVEDFEVYYWNPDGGEVTVFGKLLSDELSPVYSVGGHDL